MIQEFFNQLKNTKLRIDADSSGVVRYLNGSYVTFSSLEDLCVKLKIAAVEEPLEVGAQYTPMQDLGFPVQIVSINKRVGFKCAYSNGQFCPKIHYEPVEAFRGFFAFRVPSTEITDSDLSGVFEPAAGKKEARKK